MVKKGIAWGRGVVWYGTYSGMAKLRRDSMDQRVEWLKKG